MCDTDKLNHCAKCGDLTVPGNLLCPYHLREYWHTQGHTAISPICPSSVADNQDEWRAALGVEDTQECDAVRLDDAGKVRDD